MGRLSGTRHLEFVVLRVCTAVFVNLFYILERYICCEISRTIGIN